MHLELVPLLYRTCKSCKAFAGPAHQAAFLCICLTDFYENKKRLTGSRRRKIHAAGRKETSFPYSSGFQGVTFTVQEGQTF